MASEGLAPQVTLDRDYYPKQFEIYEYLAKTFGSSLLDEPAWRVSQAFGYTTIYFRYQSQVEQFQKWLKKTYPHLR